VLAFGLSVLLLKAFLTVNIAKNLSRYKSHHVLRRKVQPIWEDVRGFNFFAGAFFLFQVARIKLVGGKKASSFAILERREGICANCKCTCLCVEGL